VGERRVTQAQFDLIEGEIVPFEIGTRTQSAALLAWFLQHVWRLDPEDIDDCICDGSGDKGIDGLHVDESLSELTIFQAKHRTSVARTQGDSDLRNLVGAGKYFESVDTYDGLMASEPNLELRQLLTRLGIRQRIADGLQTTRLLFVTNGRLDPAGSDYCHAVQGCTPVLEVWDRARIAGVADRTRRPDLRPETVVLPIVGVPILLDLAAGEEMAVAVTPATALTALPGIGDRSLFSRNVRLSIGRTRINNELNRTIRDRSEHKRFTAYHNGLTLLTRHLAVTSDALELDQVSVVNGCQSLVALYDNQNALSDDLRVLVKVVQIPPDSGVADQITYRTNNQNAVDMRDQRSTDPVMRDLQAQVREAFGANFGFSVRAGELLGTKRVLSNQLAAQLITAVYLQEPWAAVRKVRLFDEDFRRIFNRSIDAHALYLLCLLGETVDSHRDELRADLRASFASVRFALAYLVAKSLRLTDLGQALLASPEGWLPGKEHEVLASLDQLAEDIVQSVNFYVDAKIEEVPDFDPKVAFKSRVGITELEHYVIQFSRRQARRDEDLLFNTPPLA
jgi:hypothetical protein